MRISDWSSDVCSSDLPFIHEMPAKLTVQAVEQHAPALQLLAADPQEPRNDPLTLPPVDGARATVDLNREVVAGNVVGQQVLLGHVLRPRHSVKRSVPTMLRDGR